MAKQKTIELCKPLGASFDTEEMRLYDLDNSYIVDTKGFVPLEVKFKRFEQGGILAQLRADEFSSSDYREMYLSPDMEINQWDDLEDIQNKLALQQEFRQKILSKTSSFAPGEVSRSSEADEQKSEPGAKGEVHVDTE